MQRVVLITGVAGGIGYATAELFFQRGWIVVGTDRQQLPGDKKAIHHFLQLDLASPESPKMAFEFIKDKIGRLDALVNNAAVQICKKLLDTTEEDWDLLMTVNLKAPFVCSKLAFPLLKLRGGAIINVSSVHAVATSVGIAAYASSKGALSALTRNSALEFAPDGVRVNAVLPGAVDTAMLHSGLSRGHVEGTNIEELIRGLGKKTVMGRVGHPSEIACAIYFLADREMSSFMTGQSIVVDGGATARLSTE